MYTVNDLNTVSAQKKKRITLIVIPCLVLLAGIVYSLAVRLPWYITGIMTILLGVLLIFCLDMFVKPLARYEKHIEHALNGKTRQITGCLKDFEHNLVEKEKLLFYPLILNVNKMENEEDDRLFYWDAALPRPQWDMGQKLTFTYYDKRITAWQAE